LGLSNQSCFYHFKLEHGFSNETQFIDNNLEFSFWFPGTIDDSVTKEHQMADYLPFRILMIADNHRGTMHLLNLLNLALQKEQYQEINGKKESVFTFSPSSMALLASRGKASKYHPPNLKYHFLFHLGDAVAHTFWLNEWQTCFFDPLSWSGITPTLPVALVSGNHDAWNGIQGIYTEMERSWYALDIGKARFIILDSNRFGESEQQTWINEQVTSDKCTKASFCILLVHIAPYIEYWESKDWAKDSTGPERTRAVISEAKRYFYEHSGNDAAWPIVMVISGHQHNYQRGERDESMNGTGNKCFYIIAGGGGGILDTEKVHDWGDLYNVTYTKGHFYSEIVIYEKVLEWNVYTSDGNLLDSISIKSHH